MNLFLGHKRIKYLIAYNGKQGESAAAYVLIIMSHGGRGYVLGVDGERVYMDDDIITPMDGNHWPEMKGRPKVVIVQACRGQRE